MLRGFLLLGVIALAGCNGRPGARRMIPYSELESAAVAPGGHRSSYGTDALQFGELRLPRGSDPAALVVLIHGGCWLARYDIKHIGGAAAALADAGFAVWSIEYRRVGNAGGGWPGTFDDVSLAVDHVRRLASEFPRIDTSRVVLMGHSAGGHLALWAASRRQAEMNGLYVSSQPPLSVAGVVSLAGITDLAAYGVTPGCGASVTPLLGGTPAQVADRYRAASPVERLPIGVPVIAVHGAADPIVPLSQSHDFARRQQAAGGSAEVHVVPSAGHFDLVAPQAEAWAVVVRAVRALTARPGDVRVNVGAQ